jgi:branched-chain amino acid transport system ATP-binding protein
LIRTRSGTITYNGRPIQTLPPHERLALGLCFVPQERALFPDMTVTENLRMGGYVLNDRALTEERVEQVFAKFPALSEKRASAAKQLSGGQQQMLTMGRALVLRPAIVMLDEPSLGLAPKIVEQVFELIDQFRQDGMSVLLVEQNAIKGLQHADWGLVLDLGQNSFEGPPDVVLNDPRIRELYLGKGAA